MEPTLLENLTTLIMLVLLQAVLGFDNLLYISLESQHAPLEKQAYVRRVGILIAIALRIVLLFVLISVIDLFQDRFMHFTDAGGNIISGTFNIHSLIVLLGGGFILYTAIKEIWHMIALEEDGKMQERKPSSVGKVIGMIVLMNLVFSFDSILGAMALTKVFWVMAVAIVIGGLLMLVLADRVTTFLRKNRMYEVLGLFVLFLVGVLLLSEGGHIAHLKLFGNEVTPMSKTTFYFVIVVLVIVDLVQGRYQKKLMAAKEQK